MTFAETGMSRRENAQILSTPMDILLVDDSRTNRLIFQCMFKMFPWTVHYAENGQEALNALGHRTFDLLFMDINMPVMNGIEAVQALRAREWRENCGRLPVIALTSNHQPAQIKSYLDAGMDGHVTKPFAKDAMLTEMANVLGARAATEP